MTRLLPVLFITIIPTVLGLSLVKLSEKQKVGLPMFAYSKLNISDLNSVAEKFRQYFTDVTESLGDFVESLTASEDRVEIVQGADVKELKNEGKIEEKGVLVNNIESKKQELNDVVQDIKKKAQDIKIITNTKDKSQESKAVDKKLVKLDKPAETILVDKPLLVEEPKLLKTVELQVDENDVVLNVAKKVLEDKIAPKLNDIEDLKVNDKKENISEPKKNINEVKKPEPYLKTESDLKPDKISNPPEKTKPVTQKEIKGDSGVTEEL